MMFWREREIEMVVNDEERLDGLTVLLCVINLGLSERERERERVGVKKAYRWVM